jgi:DNA-binding XRE family transcriptional regulator
MPDPIFPYYTYLPKIINFLGYPPPLFDKEIDKFIEKIKFYRLTHGLSQENFAKLIGVDKTTVAKWELGKHMPLKKLVERPLALLK